MTRLSEEEAREFIDLLDRVEDEMEQASNDASELSDDDFLERWGGYPSRILSMIGRDNYREFVETVYFDQ